MTINDLIAHYRTMKSLHAEIPDTLDTKLRQIERVFGRMGAASSGREVINQAKTEWGNSAPGTMKRYLVQLRAVMRRCEADGVLPKAPIIDMPYVNDTVYTDVSAADVKMLLDYIKWTEPSWYPLTLVLTHTGARLGEALRLTQSSFTKRGVVLLKLVGRRTKTVQRTVPYTSRLVREVACGAIFRNESGRIVPDSIADNSVSTCLGRVIDASVIALGLPSLRVHDLRHAFASVIAENGADLADIATALGHSNPSMAMRYRGLVRSRLASIVAGIE